MWVINGFVLGRNRLLLLWPECLLCDPLRTLRAAEGSKCHHGLNFLGGTE